MVVRPEFVDERGDDAEDQSMHGGLGNEMADGDGQDARIFPRIVTLPVENDQSLQHGHDQKYGSKDLDYGAGIMTQQVIGA